MTEPVARGIDRRTIIKGAAWTVPIVMVGSSAPAMAVTGDVLTVVGNGCKLPGEGGDSFNTGYVFGLLANGTNVTINWIEFWIKKGPKPIDPLDPTGYTRFALAAVINPDQDDECAPVDFTDASQTATVPPEVWPRFAPNPPSPPWPQPPGNGLVYKRIVFPPRPGGSANCAAPPTPTPSPTLRWTGPFAVDGTFRLAVFISDFDSSPNAQLQVRYELAGEEGTRIATAYLDGNPTTNGCRPFSDWTVYGEEDLAVWQIAGVGG